MFQIKNIEEHGPLRKCEINFMHPKSVFEENGQEQPPPQSPPPPKQNFVTNQNETEDKEFKDAYEVETAFMKGRGRRPQIQQSFFYLQECTYRKHLHETSVISFPRISVFLITDRSMETTKHGTVSFCSVDTNTPTVRNVLRKTLFHFYWNQERTLVYQI